MSGDGEIALNDVEDPTHVQDVETIHTNADNSNSEEKKDSSSTSSDKKDSSHDSDDNIDTAKSLDNEKESSNDDIEKRITWVSEVFFLMIGTNILYAYNTFINGLDFFEMIFPGKNASTNIARAYNITAGIINFIVIPFIERFGLVKRYYSSSIITAILTTFLCIYVNVGYPKFEVIITVAVLTAIAQGVLWGTSMSFAGLFGAKSSTMAISGVALGGLITSIVRIISKLCGPAEGWLYFGFTAIFNILTVVLFFMYMKTDICKERIQLSQTSSDFFQRTKRIKSVFVKVWPFFLECVLAMVITLTFFPGYITGIPSKHGLKKDWVITLIMFSFMVGDFVGRMITRWWMWPGAKYLWIPHVLRLIFIPLYVLPIEGVCLVDDIFTGGFWVCTSITFTAMSEKLEKDEIELGVFTVGISPCIGVFISSWLTFALPTH